MYIIPPHMPPREAFRTEAEYLAARNRYIQDRKKEDQLLNIVTATALVLVGVILLAAVCFVAVMAYQAIGIVGLIKWALIAFCAAGAFTITVFKVADWIE